jgi:large subunit ribosomal protein L7/L12
MTYELILAKRLDYIEEHLTRIAAAVGYPYVPMKDAVGAGIPPAVVELVDAGKKIQAIQLYRELTGAGLKEAKDVIDNLRVT